MSIRWRSKAVSNDCQDHVKALFADAEFRTRCRLSAVNSINWARIIAQTVYYFVAGTALGAPDRPVSFAVPTGNFGNVYAAHIARAMGCRSSVLSSAPTATIYFIVSSRRARCGSLGSTQPQPSMDIQISSNFERLLYEVTHRDGAGLARVMSAFSRNRPARLRCRRLATVCAD